MPSLDEPTRKKLADLVASNHVVLFMKGNRRAPACGFSATVVGLLDGLLGDYATVDVLSDPVLRDGIKEFSQWPTIPQLYVGGKFVGGCDIVRDMHKAGELEALLGVGADAAPPTITLTEPAARAIRDAVGDARDEFLRVAIDPNFQYDLSVGGREPGDVEVQAAGLTVLLDRTSARRADGLSIDYVTTAAGPGFKLDNPREPAKVKQLSAKDLKAMLDAGTKIELFDVRTEAEREIATIAGARHLDAEGEAYLKRLDRNATVVFHCHHGVRSLSAAQHFLEQGFRKVYNLAGGIEAWSTTVDPTVPRY